jgi:hypothetical protein
MFIQRPMLRDVVVAGVGCALYSILLLYVFSSQQVFIYKSWLAVQAVF